MSKKSVEKMKLSHQTTEDILINEENEVDEVETLLLNPDYKCEARKDVHKKYLSRVHTSEENEHSINNIKKLQMQVYSSNSTEIFNTSSKSSIVFSLLSIIMFALFFVVIVEMLLINIMGWELSRYDKDDMYPYISNGDVLIETANSNIKAGDIITFKYNNEIVTRFVVEISGNDIKLKDGSNNLIEDCTLLNVKNNLKGVVVAQMGSMGIIVLHTYNNWYFYAAGLFVVAITFFICKISSDGRYNNMLLDRIDKEKEHREKRKQILAQNAEEAENNANWRENVNLNKAPNTKREKKLQKLYNQLQQRRLRQVEHLKGKTSEVLTNNETDINKILLKDIDNKDMEEIDRTSQENKIKDGQDNNI